MLQTKFLLLFPYFHQIDHCLIIQFIQFFFVVSVLVCCRYCRHLVPMVCVFFLAILARVYIMFLRVCRSHPAQNIPTLLRIFIIRPKKYFHQFKHPCLDYVVSKHLACNQSGGGNAKEGYNADFEFYQMPGQMLSILR